MFELGLRGWSVCTVTHRTRWFPFLVEVGDFVRHVVGEGWWNMLFGGVVFACYPTSIEQLLAVAAAKRVMPPKSTWFDPKLWSGLFVHKLER